METTNSLSTRVSRVVDNYGDVVTPYNSLERTEKLHCGRKSVNSSTNNNSGEMSTVRRGIQSDIEPFKETNGDSPFVAFAGSQD